MAERLGHIKLNSKYYRVDLNTYRGRDVNDFSPRASTPGGGIVFSQMDAYQMVTQEDWSHGFGFDWFEDVAGYALTDGYIDTREPKMVSLFQGPTANVLGSLSLLGLSYTGQAARPIVAYGRPTTAGHSGLYYFLAATSTWTAEATFNNLTVNHAWNSGVYTFVTVNGNNRFQKTANMVNWTNAGNTDCCVDYRHIVVHDGYVFVSKANSGTHTATHAASATHNYKSNQVYYGSAEDLSDLEGATEDDPDVIIVGPTGYGVVNMISYNGDLFFFRQDSVYKMNKDRSGAVRVLDYRDQTASGNFACVSNFNGSLYFNVAGSFYQWNGVRVQDVTPRPMSVDVGTTQKRFINFWGSVSIGKYLYVIAGTRTATDGTSLLVYDGVGWSLLATTYDATYHLTPGSGLTYLPQYEKMYFGSTSTAASKYMYEFIIQTDFGVTNNYIVGNENSNRLYTSKIDAGFRLVTKSCPALLVQKSYLGNTVGTQIVIYYRTDANTTWTKWGTGTSTYIVTADGTTILKDPLGDGTGKSTLEFKWIQFRIGLITGTATRTPVLEKFGIKVLLRPETTYGYSFTVIGAEGVEYAGAIGDDRSSYTIMNDLRTARASKAPIEFIDPWGDTHYVYITSLQELAVEEEVGDIGPKPNIEQQIMVNLMEVLNG